jgi:hypothetical protein
VNEKVFQFKSSLIIVGIPPTFVAKQGIPNQLASHKTREEQSAFEGKIKK